EIRSNAPLGLLTLGRLVSFKDFEDFTLAFPGVAKARAKLTGDSRTRPVFITVAGPKGAEISEESNTYKQLIKALRESGDPRVVVIVKSYRKAVFTTAAKVTVDPDFVPTIVLTAVRKALADAFSFNSQSFGQSVTKSQVISVMHVPGVVSVDLEKLARTDGYASDIPEEVL